MHELVDDAIESFEFFVDGVLFFVEEFLVEGVGHEGEAVEQLNVLLVEGDPVLLLERVRLLYLLDVVDHVDLQRVNPEFLENPYLDILLFAFGEALKQDGKMLRLVFVLFEQIPLDVVVPFGQKWQQDKDHHSH